MSMEQDIADMKIMIAGLQVQANNDDIKIMIAEIQVQLNKADSENLKRIFFMKDLMKIFNVKRPETVYARIEELEIEVLPTRYLQVTATELRNKHLI